jgi:hypothetical protein
MIYTWRAQTRMERAMAAMRIVNATDRSLDVYYCAAGDFPDGLAHPGPLAPGASRDVFDPALDETYVAAGFVGAIVLPPYACGRDTVTTNSPLDSILVLSHPCAIE